LRDLHRTGAYAPLRNREPDTSKPDLEKIQEIKKGLAFFINVLMN
jgi:hypothetical protein